MRRRRGFSLIEVLVVVVIVGVLFAVGMAVFAGAGRKNPGRAAEQLVGVLRLARQHAVSQRQWVVVVFPGRMGGAYSGGGGDSVDKCLRSYAVLAVQNDMDGLARADQIPPNMEFAFVSDWKTLPEGIYFDEDVGLAGNYVFQTPSTAFLYPLDPARPDPGQAGTPARPMGAILFRPNGRAYAMDGGNQNGNFWQDKDHGKIYLTAEKFYEASGGTLSAPTSVPGVRAVVEIGNKTGQVRIVE